MSSSSLGPDPGLVEAVAQRVVDLLREEALMPLNVPRLLTVAQVAREFGVSSDWVYANARHLGAIRMGSGPKARLRFDRDTLGARITRLGSNGSVASTDHKRKRGAGSRKRPEAELLPIVDSTA
jgi:hypothetical protein